MCKEEVEEEHFGQSPILLLVEAINELTLKEVELIKATTNLKEDAQTKVFDNFEFSSKVDGKNNEAKEIYNEPSFEITLDYIF